MTAQRSYYRNMTRALAREIRDLYFSRWFKQREIAEMYGIRQHSVSRIVSGRVWG
jgi:DNA-binding transcriptional regulator LsrR (DeoR family)